MSEGEKLVTPEVPGQDRLEVIGEDGDKLLVKVDGRIYAVESFESNGGPREFQTTEVEPSEAGE